MATTNNGQATKKGLKMPSEQDARIYDTLEAVQAAGCPVDYPKWRLIELKKDGQPAGFTWADGPAAVLRRAAKQAGYAASEYGKTPGGPLTNERAAAKLADLSDEELASLGFKRAKTARK
jgi:hypothetical protein